jgi:hypothetical protein
MSSLGNKAKENARSKEIFAMRAGFRGEKEEAISMRKKRYKSCKPCHVGPVPSEEVVSSRAMFRS